jgi:hypothetical protein
MIKKRWALHVGGYEPTSPDAYYRRFIRELRRFQNAWSVTSSASESAISEDFVGWSVTTQGSNWRVETNFQIMRWDDVVDQARRRPMWRRVPLGLLAFADFLVGGAFWGYLRTNWRYALFFLYPLLIFCCILVISILIGIAGTQATGFGALGLLAGIAAFALLFRWPGQLLQLRYLFDDWIFSRSYLRGGEQVLDRRLDRAAAALVAAARDSELDEVVVIGHSLGAMLAIQIIDRALRREGGFGANQVHVALVTVGSSALKIGLHRRGTDLRASIQRVGATPAVFWAEYQSLTDVMNFYKTNPLAATGTHIADRPLVRIVRVRDMLDPDRYRRIRRNLLRLHNQFVRANDRSYAYDYFMLLLGPASVESHARAPDGLMSAIADDGTYRERPDESRAAHIGTCAVAEEASASGASSTSTREHRVVMVLAPSMGR